MNITVVIVLFLIVIAILVLAEFGHKSKIKRDQELKDLHNCDCESCKTEIDLEPKEPKKESVPEIEPYGGFHLGEMTSYDLTQYTKNIIDKENGGPKNEKAKS
jgi:hypothetical protein